MAEPEIPDLQPEDEEEACEPGIATDDWRFGGIPGRKDPSAARAAIRQREIVRHGPHPDEDNPAVPGEVGTGHIGLGPEEPEG